MKKLLSLSVLVILLPTIAFSDVAWPGLIVAGALVPWTVVVGLAVEYQFIKHLFDIEDKRALWAVIVANAFSTFIGFFLISFFTILYGGIGDWSELSTTHHYYVQFASSFFTACIITVLLETPVYMFIFKLKVRAKEFSLIFLANSISVALSVLTSAMYFGYL